MEGYLIEEKKSGRAPVLVKTVYSIIGHLKELGITKIDHDIMMHSLATDKKFDLLFNGRRIVIAVVSAGGKAK